TAVTMATGNTSFGAFSKRFTFLGCIDCASTCCCYSAMANV
ncbi:hypothetical protein MPER_11277, partial [Moniliophthora perniciosa FA553]